MYLVVGLLVGAAFGGFAFWANNKGVQTKWFDWVLLIIGAFLLIFAAQNFFGGFEESTPRFSWLILLTVGLPGIICLAVPALLIRSRNTANS